MEDTSISKSVDYDYDQSIEELLDFLKDEKSTFGMDPEIVGPDYFKTEFRVPSVPMEIRKFTPPDKMAANAAGALKNEEVPSLIQKLQEDDYYIIHFPLIIDTKFPFSEIELRVRLKGETPNYFFVNTFPEPKENVIVDGKLNGSITSDGEGSLKLQTPEVLNPVAPVSGKIDVKAQNTFNLNYNWTFAIKKSLIKRNGGDNERTVKWIFKKTPQGNGLDETISNITLLMKKPKNTPFSDIEITGSGTRSYKSWPEWLVKLTGGASFTKKPRIHTLIKEGFTIMLNNGQVVTWPANVFEAYA